jgi:sigma54-dependent transcription regulator
VAENCAAFSEQLLESELFGHKKGAFTGASATRRASSRSPRRHDLPGRNRRALAGDAVQAVARLAGTPGPRIGANDYKKINVRVITATEQGFEAMVKEGKFREDLYYRINVVKVVPSGAPRPQGGHSSAGRSHAEEDGRRERGEGEGASQGHDAADALRLAMATSASWATRSSAAWPWA